MAVEKLQVYKCKSCGIIVEALDGGEGELSCCDEPMILFSEKTEDAGKEKHVPIIEALDIGVRVKIGSIPHPMVEDHFIEWIQLLAGGKTYRRFLKPGDAPEAVFEIKAEEIELAREYCSVHGLWKSS